MHSKTTLEFIMQNSTDCSLPFINIYCVITMYWIIFNSFPIPKVAKLMLIRHSKPKTAFHKGILYRSTILLVLLLLLITSAVATVLKMIKTHPQSDELWIQLQNRKLFFRINEKGTKHDESKEFLNVGTKVFKFTVLMKLKIKQHLILLFQYKRQNYIYMFARKYKTN